MKREKYFWKKLFCFVFLFTVVTGCGSVYAAEHGTAEEKETEDHSGMLEDELEQMEESLLDEFDFRQIDQLSGETELGEKVRFQLLDLMQENDKVVLDFSGVNVVSNSFADECLAKLLLIMPLEELKQRTTFRGLNEFARKNIAIAFRRRLNAMKAVKRV